MSKEILDSLIESIGDVSFLTFKAWEGEEKLIFLTFCHFCYDHKQYLVPDVWDGYKVIKIKGIYIKGMSKFCWEHNDDFRR